MQNLIGYGWANSRNLLQLGGTGRVQVQRMRRGLFPCEQVLRKAKQQGSKSAQPATARRSLHRSYAMIMADSVFGDQLRPVAGRDGARHANLDFVAAAHDAEGRTMSGQLSSVQEKLTPNRLLDISANGYRVRLHLDVPITAAWLRVCVRDSLDDRAGCAESALHHPAISAATGPD